MALIRSIFWFAIFLGATFTFTVIFEHGFSDFNTNAQKEFDVIKHYLSDGGSKLRKDKVDKSAQ